MIHDSCTGTTGMKGAQEEAWAVAKKGTQTFEQPCNFVADCVRQEVLQGELLVFNPAKQMLKDDEINKIHS